MIDDNMPFIVMSVTLVMIVLAVGTFAFMVTTNEIGYETTQTEDFDVTDPTVTQHCELAQSVDEIIYVQQYNGYVWQAVGAAHYDVVGQVVVVQASGLQG